MNYDVKESGNRIRQLRMDNGFTQEYVALALSIDRSFYNRIEMGKKGCSIDLLIQLSDLFHVSLDYLVVGKHSDTLQNTVEKAQLKKEMETLIAHLEKFCNSL